MAWWRAGRVVTPADGSSRVSRPALQACGCHFAAGPCSGSLMLHRGVRPVALQASDVVRKRQRRHCGGCFCAAFRYSARPVRWRAPAGILLLHLSCMLVARGVWPCRRGRLALQYGPFGPVIRAVSHGHTSRVSNLLCARRLRNGALPWR